MAPSGASLTFRYLPLLRHADDLDPVAIGINTRPSRTSGPATTGAASVSLMMTTGFPGAIVARIERSSIDEPHARGREVLGADIGLRGQSAARQSGSAGADSGLTSSPLADDAQRRKPNPRRLLDTRECGDPIARRRDRRPDVCRRYTPGSARRRGREEHARPARTPDRPAGTVETADEQTTADEQRQGQRHLRHDERAPDLPTLVRRCRERRS